MSQSAEQARPLEALSLPMRGNVLIEASAGTGKTFTIASLYVRLILGHGELPQAGRTYLPEEILVVTFTEAATEELRDRIRARLVEAAQCFAAGAHDSDGFDQSLLDIRAEYAADLWPACAQRLQWAADSMDLAAISTIHSWCYRMLRQHAFGSNSLFQQTLEEDTSLLMRSLVRDYWRIHGFALDQTLAQEWVSHWKDPDALEKALKGLLKHADLLDEEEQEPSAMLQSVRAQRLAVLAAIKAPWQQWALDLHRAIDDAAQRGLTNGARLRSGSYPVWMAELKAWAHDPEQILPNIKADSSFWRTLTLDGIGTAWKKNATQEHPLLTHPALQGVVHLQEALDEIEREQQQLNQRLLQHAARWVLTRFEEVKRQRGLLGFDDFLKRLRQALYEKRGQTLAQRIRQQFPIALVDEFQDTDPQQYAIFAAIYGDSNSPSGMGEDGQSSMLETALLLIGDPKQAIYGFRGADIHTYLQARRDCAGQIYTLDRNYRSSEEMVKTVNDLFTHADEQQTLGAFLFGGRGTSPIPFQRVEAQGQARQWMVKGAASPALSFWALPPKEGKTSGWSKEAYQDQIADVCATHIVELLNLGQQGQAGFLGEAFAPVMPGDIAVLVNNRDEAHAMRRALRRRGVRSVYLSDRESVYATQAARDMQLWLTACADPFNVSAVSSALATSTLKLSWSELDAVHQEAQVGEQRLLQFQGYQMLWQRQGVLPLLRHFIQDFALPARLLAEKDGGGERLLTDVLHLAELLQEASALLEGEWALLRHLAEEIAAAQEPGRSGAWQMRLESDEHLLKVVTVHKSKGLQYPLVFLPFAAGVRKVNEKRPPWSYHDHNGQTQLSFSWNEELAQRVERERLAEDLRKLYVALTRAEFATWVGMAPLKETATSALNYLLGCSADASLQGERVQTLCTESTSMSLLPVTVDEQSFSYQQQTQTLGEPRLSRPVLRQDWRITSYSALSVHAPKTAVDEDSPRADRLWEELTENIPDTPQQKPAPGSIHAFHRGAMAGNMLHELLEWMAHEGFASLAREPERLRDTVARRCQRRGWSQWIDPLQDWLMRLLRAPWPLHGLTGCGPCLAELGQTLPELEFWVGTTRVDVDALDRLVREHTLNGLARPRLKPQALNGRLKGFIDLVFEHQGRYYIADYKSNYLGPDHRSYDHESMGRAMAKSRYDLQFVLYLLALHRLLKQRLPDYDYAKHMGGAVYVFLRGAGEPGYGIYSECPPQILIDTLDRWFDGQAGEGA
ncbi:DNA helicase/exodeoxyribonuclease V, beta subunit [Ectothiorhodosinus mongolicus]|uniref:RecBCD enzyme subunit RecB n=1 Tax=Ectothiorhodosinus mongolicus TaxID=233100 RepID=A0A1R3VMD4_9GAMM|nr:exodeoxyribonuclease V subunit beta [Ectothiorhodosinus mongolicus]ULX56246.1 exodeoxyribonuclease V subunit beta [Ectothiorhodosinus mongolicus]SIT65750.1 DNA helicase/exodeoxyribonuclease V, beta subunit [Ectothiorhodosinus mongolicus]